ncbi:MAG TPA: response regulator [Sphingomicrobium sp.]
MSIKDASKGDRARLVVVVDDDPAVRDSTATLLRHAGFEVETFESGSALVERGVPAGTEVILLDMLMPGISGLETLRMLREDSNMPAVIMITGHGDIPLAVEAMKLGAVEFLEKPYPMRTLLDLVAKVEKSTNAASAHPGRDEATEKVGQLSERQKQVLKGLALGEPSKVTAHRLGLSARTVEAYRGHVFTRLGVRGMAEAVRIAVVAGLLDG